MKKLLFTSAFLVLFLNSCSNNDSSTPAPTPTPTSGLSVDGSTYNNFNGKVVDNYHFSGTEASFYFVFSDGSINVSASPATYCGFTTTNASIAVKFTVNTIGGNTILPGTYTFYDNSGSPSVNNFDTFSIYLDKNGNHSFTDSQDKYLYATAGTIIVTGTSPNYVINMNVTLNNGSNFQYTYNSGFTYINNRAN